MNGDKFVKENSKKISNKNRKYKVTNKTLK